MGGNTTSAMQSPVIVAATAKHTATVIFLHGLGDTGLGWSSVFEAIRQPHIKYICPTAPVIPVTLNGGMRMTAWFDLCSLDPNGREDESGIKSAAEGIHRLIADEEKAGISSDRIVLGGFSMGGALALYSGLRYPKPLAGILGLSCWLPLFKQFPVKGAPLSAEVVQRKATPPPRQPTVGSEVNLTDIDHPGQGRTGQREFISHKAAAFKKGKAAEDADSSGSADRLRGDEEHTEGATSTSSSEPVTPSGSDKDGQEETTAAVGNHETPILLCHGDCDDLVPLHWGQLTSELLKKFAKDVTFRQYKGMGHSSCEEETKDIAAYLLSRLPPKPE